MDDAAQMATGFSPLDGLLPDLGDLAARLQEMVLGGDAAGRPVNGELPAFLAQLPVMVYVLDRTGEVMFANREALDLFGQQTLEEMRGRRVADFFGMEAREGVAALEAALLRGGRRVHDVEVEMPVTSGRDGWLLLVGAQLADRAGRVTGMVVLARDITARRRTEFLRRGHAALLEQIARGYPLEDILDGLVRLAEAQLYEIFASILLYDDETGCLRQGAAPSLPAEYNAVIDGVKAGENVGSCGTAAWLRQPVLVSDIWTDERWAGYVPLARHFGWRSCWSTPILDASGTLFGTFALYSREVREPTELEMEITAMATDLAAIAFARARAEEQIRHLANHDGLTGLPNRRHFLERFAAAIEEASLAGRHLVIAYFDLDGFKQINDTLGHGAGDAVLREVAARLSASVREGDLVVRLGGDEFAVVMACEAAEQAQLVARLAALREEIARPLRYGERTIGCAGSMGIALFPRDGATPEALLARADAGMYDAKKRSRSRLRRDGAIRSL